jgi:hypothetical protein
MLALVAEHRKSDAMEIALVSDVTKTMPSANTTRRSRTRTSCALRSWRLRWLLCDTRWTGLRIEIVEYVKHLR